MKSALNAAIKLKSRLKEDPKPQDSGFRVLFCFLLFLLLKILFRYRMDRFSAWTISAIIRISTSSQSSTASITAFLKMCFPYRMLSQSSTSGVISRALAMAIRDLRLTWVLPVSTLEIWGLDNPVSSASFSWVISLCILCILIRFPIAL